MTSVFTPAQINHTKKAPFVNAKVEFKQNTNASHMLLFTLGIISRFNPENSILKLFLNDVYNDILIAFMFLYSFYVELFFFPC